MHDNFDEELTKNRILSENKTFKAAFTATLGYYAGRALVHFLTLIILASVAFIFYKLLH
jgi:hypothetical protein